jgi:hypothetical protein
MFGAPSIFQSNTKDKYSPNEHMVPGYYSYTTFLENQPQAVTGDVEVRSTSWPESVRDIN